MQKINMHFYHKVEQEHEEQMRQLKQRKKKQATPPPPPKTITVMAGKMENNHDSISIPLLHRRNSFTVVYFIQCCHIPGSRSKAAWPIAPGSGSGVRPVQVELTSGSSEYQEEMEKNRREVAEVFKLLHNLS